MWIEKLWSGNKKNGTALHIEMWMDKFWMATWRVEQGIIYDCYVKYVLEEVSDLYPGTEVF